MAENEIILPDDPRAARYEMRGVWISRLGRLFSDKDEAQMNGCTHTRCDCGAISEYKNCPCNACRENARHETWLKMPAREWDGNTPVCIDRGERLFRDASDLEDWIDDYNSSRVGDDPEITEDDLDLVHIVLHPRQVRDDYLIEDMEEGYTLPKPVVEALSELNAALTDAGIGRWESTGERVTHAKEAS